MSELATATTQDDLIHMAEQALTQNYRQQPLVLARGKGAKVWDLNGREYLDLVGGIAACPLGHAHPVLTAAISEQAARLIHVSNLYYNEPQIRLAARLAELAWALGQPRVFFCNSGAEANEAALKLAKRFQVSVKGQADRVEVLSFSGSFHGRTIATVALTGQEKYRVGLGPLIEWARFLPWPGQDVSVPKILAQVTEQTCAVLVEPIQAEGGVRVPPRGFFAALRQRCDETGTVLIFDEVQTGIGRTGDWFGFQGEAVVPDILSLAKGLGGGVPIGAMVASDKVAAGFSPGVHASTFGGNPLACAASLAVLGEIEKNKLLGQVNDRGRFLSRLLAPLLEQFPNHLQEVRGRGLLLGLALHRDVTPVVTQMRERGVLLSAAGGTVLRFVPPFVIREAELKQAVDILREVLTAVFSRE